VKQILKLEPNGVDRTCDCCGFECVDNNGNNVPNLIITQAINITKTGSGIGIIGVYGPRIGKIHSSLYLVLCLTVIDPDDTEEKLGTVEFPIGAWWIKNISIKGGIVQIRLYQELLKNLIERGNAKPSFVFTKEYRIEDAAQAYRDFSDHKIIKAVFKFDKPPKSLKRKGKDAGLD